MQTLMRVESGLSDHFKQADGPSLRVSRGSCASSTAAICITPA